MEITLTINKDSVWEAVAESSAYTAVKGGTEQDGAPERLDRIATIDEDEGQLGRFWEESRTDLCQELIGLVLFEGMVADTSTVVPTPLSVASVAVTPQVSIGQHYELRLEVSRAFDSALLPSMRVSLYNYFVTAMCAKWYVYTNKEEAGAYADKAAAYLDDLHRKAVYKRKPTRPTYDD